MFPFLTAGWSWGQISWALGSIVHCFSNALTVRVVPRLPTTKDPNSAPATWQMELLTLKVWIQLALQIYFMNHMNVTQKSHQSNFIDV
jgi:hypothetical protein